MRGVECCSGLLAGVDQKREDLLEGVLWSSGSERIPFVFMWMVDIEEAETGWGFWVKSQMFGKKKVPGELVGEKSVGGEQVTAEIIWIFIFQFLDILRVKEKH